MRHALALLADGGVVAVFPQALISHEVGRARGAVGLLALRSGAPVVPIAISGTQAVHATVPFLKRAAVSVRFGAPMTFTRTNAGAPRSRAVADAILQSVRALLDEDVSVTHAAISGPASAGRATWTR
jgi:1-acyl-sn-glycerol-3-phosphate acyltransferase